MGTANMLHGNIHVISFPCEWCANNSQDAVVYEKVDRRGRTIKNTGHAKIPVGAKKKAPAKNINVGIRVSMLGRQNINVRICRSM